MYLSKKTTITVSDNEAIVLGHMAYAASKLWNVANYQKRNYKELGLTSFPNGYDQNVSLKNSLWYKSLPSQTAQYCLKTLHDSWKSYFKLLKTKGIQNPRPPRYKRDVIPFVFIQNGFKKMEGDTFRFSISKQLKLYLQEKFGIEYDYLFLKIKCFSELSTIKQIQFEKIAPNRFSVIATYKVDDIEFTLPTSGTYIVYLENGNISCTRVEGQKKYYIDFGNGIKQELILNTSFPPDNKCFNSILLFFK